MLAVPHLASSTLALCPLAVPDMLFLTQPLDPQKLSKHNKIMLIHPAILGSNIIRLKLLKPTWDKF